MTHTLFPQRLEKAAEAVRKARVGGITPPQNGTGYDMKLAYAAITAYLGDDMVVMPREPTFAMKIAGAHAHDQRPSEVCDIYRAMLSAPTVSQEG